MFYIDVAKVDQDVAHVAMAIRVCFKCMFQMFHLFQTYVVSVSSGCCKCRFRCCIYMQEFQVFSFGCCNVCNMATHMFLNFSGVLQVFQMYVAGVSVVLDVCFKCFI